MSQSIGKQVQELKTAGHLMALEAGVYCVFLTPGDVTADPDTGLPGVQVTAPPGQEQGSVSVVTFQPSGWVSSNSAALVRVARGSARVLVTVYQERDTAREAPKLQVMKVADGLMAEAKQAQTAAPTTGIKAAKVVEVLAHVYGRGDVGGMLGDRVGEAGSNRWIEGFAVAPKDVVPMSDLEYQAVLGRGWLSPWSEGGQFCGSRGMSLPILGLKVRLRGSSAQNYRTVLAASFVDGSAVGPVRDDEVCEAPSMAALESFSLKFEPVQMLASERGSPTARPRALETQPKAKRKAVSKAGIRRR